MHLKKHFVRALCCFSRLITRPASRYFSSPLARLAVRGSRWISCWAISLRLTANVCWCNFPPESVSSTLYDMESLKRKVMQFALLDREFAFRFAVATCRYSETLLFAKTWLHFSHFSSSLVDYFLLRGILANQTLFHFLLTFVARHWIYERGNKKEEHEKSCSEAIDKQVANNLLLLECALSGATC